MQNQLPERLVAGRYRLVRELGRGGMGVVWLADDNLLGREVALKEVRPPPGLSEADREVFLVRAQREARSAARIHHVNAVTLHDVLFDVGEGAVYLIMELIHGSTLADLVRRQSALPAPRVARIGLQLLDVLAAAHALGIVHRDVKPGNILIAANDQVKLADFGIAHTLGDPRLTGSGVMGTPAYQAPELFESVSVTPAADLWSLGATLYYAAEGHGPFDRDSTGATLRAIVIDDVPTPRCEPQLAAAISAMLRRAPTRRATIDEARTELRRVPARESPATDPQQSESIRTQPLPDALPSDPTPEAPSSAPPGRRAAYRRAIIIAATLMALVAGTFGVIALAGGLGAPSTVHPLHHTTTNGSAKLPFSADTAGQMVAFKTSSEHIAYDYYVTGWHGPAVLPGTLRADSPIVVSPDGSHVYFIERNGHVAGDYHVPGSGWKGPGLIGGVAAADSGLAVFQGNGTGTHPAVAFVSASGELVYDYYIARWHGPAVLPGTVRRGSPLVFNPAGYNIFFIEPDGHVANDYYYSGWKGPDRTGGVAEADSGLAFSRGSTDAGTRQAVVFVNASGKLDYDYFVSGWKGPAVLPGTPRAGSPVTWSGDGTSVYFIKSNGDVATDYLSGSRWQGAYPTGGTAGKYSSLIYSPGNGTTAGSPRLMFVASDGKLSYDWYVSGWHGARPLPGHRG